MSMKPELNRFLARWILTHSRGILHGLLLLRKDLAVYLSGAFGDNGLYAQFFTQHGCHNAGFQMICHGHNDHINIRNTDLSQRFRICNIRTFTVWNL